MVPETGATSSLPSYSWLQCLEKAWYEFYTMSQQCKFTVNHDIQCCRSSINYNDLPPDSVALLPQWPFHPAMLPCCTTAKQMTDPKLAVVCSSWASWVMPLTRRMMFTIFLCFTIFFNPYLVSKTCCHLFLLSWWGKTELALKHLSATLFTLIN